MVVARRAPARAGARGRPGAPDGPAARRGRPRAGEALAERLGASRGVFDRVRAMSGRLGDEQLAVVEEVLLRSDVGVATTDALVEGLRESGAPEGVTAALRASLLASLRRGALALDDGRGPGSSRCGSSSGSTARARRPPSASSRAALALEGRSVVLAAGDTFRAAAADQLETLGRARRRRRGARGRGRRPRVGGPRRAGPRRGARRGLVLADTAGRRANKANLLEELTKVRRVADRAPGQVVEVLLVLDATTGQNAIAQAREFRAAVEVTGLVLTKLDGTARGGVVLAVERELGIPVRLVGRRRAGPTTSSTSTPRPSWTRCSAPRARR